MWVVPTRHQAEGLPIGEMQGAQNLCLHQSQHQYYQATTGHMHCPSPEARLLPS